jgi:hypothetical protein
MALGVFIAGAYTGTLSSVALGLTDDGYKVSWQPKGERIEKSDVYAQKLLDVIYQGTNWFIDAEFLEANNAGPLAAAYPWGASLGLEGVIAQLGSSVGTALVLTSTANTPAAAAPATLTANQAILDPDFNPEMVYSSRLRTLPCRFALLPYSATGIKSFVLL